MAATYKITYKNHCTPQEEVDFSTGSRWYLDSDCGRKLTGEASITIDANRTYIANLAVTAVASASLTDGANDEFIYIKNTGGGSGDTIFISLESSEYTIGLSSGECFASKILDSASVTVICDTGDDSTIEYFTGRP